MKIKYLILVLLIFIMCGCTAEVNFDISDNKIKESVDIIFYQNALYPKKVIKTSFSNYIHIYAKDLIVHTIPDEPLNNINYYKKRETDLGNGYKFNYSYNFNINEYKEARTIKNAFISYDVSYNEDDNIISVFTDNEELLYFKDYPELEEVKINIKTNYLVKEENADSINDNIYTWVFKKDEVKSINLVIDTSKVINNINYTNITIIGFVMVVIVFIFLLLIFKNKKNRCVLDYKG